MKIQRAKQPSDICWENLEVRAGKFFFNFIWFCVIILFVFYISFSRIIYPLNQKSQAAVDIMPKYTECDQMSHQFVKHPQEYAALARYKYEHLKKIFKSDEAWNIADIYTAKSSEMQTFKRSYALICFCFSTNDITFNGHKEFMKALKQYKDEEFSKIGCQKIMDFRMEVLFYSIYIGIVIAITNAILEEIVIYFT